MKTRVLSIGLVILGLACLPAGKVCGAGEAQTAWIQVTGKGYPPKREISDVRKRLLARRAAVVDAYRLLAEKLSGAVPATGYRHTKGFIKGAEIKGVRYLPDGKVEIDLVLSPKGGGVCIE